jgi:hypothetical protein
MSCGLMQERFISIYAGRAGSRCCGAVGLVCAMRHPRSGCAGGDVAGQTACWRKHGHIRPRFGAQVFNAMRTNADYPHRTGLTCGSERGFYPQSSGEPARARFAVASRALQDSWADRSPDKGWWRDEWYLPRSNPTRYRPLCDANDGTGFTVPGWLLIELRLKHRYRDHHTGQSIICSLRTDTGSASDNT